MPERVIVQWNGWQGATELVEFEIFSSGLGFIEGPVWTGNGLALVSIEHGCVYRLDEQGGVAETIATGGGPNGMVAGQNALFVAQNGGIFGAKSQTAPGIQTVIGQAVSSLLPDVFNAPNDLCFGPDGRLYVTDPASEKAVFEPIEGRLLACDLASGQCQILADGRHCPNGLAFSADGQHLYMSQTYSRLVERFAVQGSTLLSEGTFCSTVNGRPDGMAIDVEGNLWICTPGTGGLEVFGPDGVHRRRLEFGAGSMTTNCCFGGVDNRDLFVTAAGLGSVLKLRAPCPGLPLRTGPTN